MKQVIVPNDDRVLIKYLDYGEIKKSQIVLSGQLRAGDNLLIGRVVHPGKSKFKVDQLIFYSEYSAAALMQFNKVVRGEWTPGEALKKENGFVVVAEDDIMAYEEETEGQQEPK